MGEHLSALFATGQKLGPVPEGVMEVDLHGFRAVLQAAPEERMDTITTRLGENNRSTVLVMDRGRLVGVIEPEDLERFFRFGPATRRSPSTPQRPDDPRSG